MSFKTLTKKAGIKSSGHRNIHTKQNFPDSTSTEVEIMGNCFFCLGTSLVNFADSVFALNIKPLVPGVQ